MTSNVRTICLGITLIVMTSFSLAHAAPVGTVQTDFGGRESIMGMVLQPDGKLVAAGYFYGSGYSNSFALSRYNTDGKLDSTFGTDGKVLTTAFAASSGYYAQAEATAIALQTDGKIVAVGFTYQSDIALACYNADGSLDSTFGTGGKVVTNWGSLNDYATAVGIQSSGKIIVGGYANTNGTFDFVLTRYNSNGSVDTTFGANGIVFTDFATSDDRIAALKVISGDKIVAVGRSGGDMAVARYNADGTLDSTFNTTGKVTTDFGGSYDEARALAIDANGYIVVTGPAGANGDIGLARYTTAGKLDSKKFGSSGKVMTDLGSFNDQSAAIGIDSNGKIVVSGYAGNGFEVLRYSSGGSLDNTFGSSGRVTTRIGSNSYEQAVALVIQGNGQIIVGGKAGTSGTQDNFALASYNAGNGSLDTDYGAKADLAVSISASPSSVKVGNNVTYTIVVSNNGPDTVDGLPVKGTPAGATFVSASSTSGSCDSYGTCILGSLPNGASATVTVVVTPTVVGTLTNTVTVNGTAADINPANNTASVDVLVDGAADLAVSMTASPTSVQVYDQMTFTTTVTNNGPEASANAALNLRWYFIATPVSIQTTAGSCTYYANDTYNCSFGTLAQGSSVTVTLVLKSLGIGTVKLIADASGLADPNAANNSANASVTVHSTADMNVSITANTDTVQVGNTVTYTLAATNLGPDAANDARVYLALPQGMSMVSMSSAQGTCTVSSCSFSSVASGASLSVTAVVKASSTGTLSVAANVQVGQCMGGGYYWCTSSDPNPADNSAPITTTVTGSADLSLTITESADPVVIGNNITYTYTIHNAGPDFSSSVNLVYGVTGADLVSISATQSEYCYTYYAYCQIGTINSGATVTVTLVVSPTGTGTVTATGTLYSTVDDPNAANNTSSASTTVTGSADLAVTMSDSPDPVKVNTTLTYTVTVTNNGPNPALSVSLSDTLPSGVTFVSGLTGSGGYCYGSTGTGTTEVICLLRTINSGASATATIEVRPTARGTISNTASVSSTVTDPVTANNSATASTTVSNK